MNSYERLFNRMSGMTVDKLPNLCIVMMFAAKQIGVPYGKYVTDYRVLSEGVLHCYEKFGIDCLCVISDPMREAEGFGTDVTIPEDDVPYAKKPLIDDVSHISKLKTIDPSLSRRMNDRLEAVRLLKEKAGKQVPVIGWVEGAFAEACDLMDISDMMTTMLDYPDETEELLSVCVKQAELFALSQIKAGAEIIGVGDAASSLIGPALYEKFALPYEKKLIDTIHKAGAKVKLHICGNINPILPLIAKTGADIVDVDHMVDIRKAGEIFPPNTSVSGNFDPVAILLEGDIQTVKNAVNNCIDIGTKTNIIAAGCEVPKFTPEQNLLAIKEMHYEY